MPSYNKQKITKKRLGQHFLKSPHIAKTIVDAAHLTGKDIVLEIGPGRGILTECICQKAKKVIAIEKDPQLFDDLKKSYSHNEKKNLRLICGDGFSTDIGESFNVFISSIPYSYSRTAILWLTMQKFDRAILLVQKEFAKKIISVETKEKRAISVLATHALHITQIGNVNKNNFDPPPKVDSVILHITQKNPLTHDMITTINKLFSYRRKTLHIILEKFNISCNGEYHTKARLEELKGDEIIKIAQTILSKKK
jgi:16S rRNA (adenine1518-N6/adenine1519-N6)-dimethyltransferase